MVYLWLVRTLAPVRDTGSLCRGRSQTRFFADAVFDNGTCSELRVGEYETNQGYASQLEGTLIVASCLRDQGPISVGRSEPSTRSELYAYHKSEIEGAGVIDGTRSIYSSLVISDADSLYKGLSFGQYRRDIVKAARLLDRDTIPS